MTRRECVRRVPRAARRVLYFFVIILFSPPYVRTYAAVIQAAVLESGCVGRYRGETGAGAGRERE